MTPAPTCYDGSPSRPPRRRPLRAGPVTLEYGQGELRYVRPGDREVIRRLHVAVRDANWGTVPGRITTEQIEAGPDSCRIRFEMEHREGPIDFAWLGTIEGNPDGTIRFRMDGVARSTSRRNRIGFCVLHPIRECAGARVRYEQGDGTRAESEFPRLIAPHNPFRELRRLAHELAPGTWADLEFEGDLFETEDQRNWIDASFKTFCTPLRLPFPVTVQAGERIAQAVTLRWHRPAHWEAVEPPAAGPEIAIGGEPIGTLPEIGLGLPDDPHAPTAREAERLRALRPAHLRADLNLSDPAHPEQLRRALNCARTIGCGLELALTVSDEAAGELSRFLRLIEELRQPTRPPIHRVLIFHETEWSTSARWLQVARDRLPGLPLFAGTLANFAELNRGRPPLDLIDGLAFAAQPQEHASDNASLVETCAALRDTLATARSFAGNLPIAVTPITLKKRVNPYATGPAPPEPADALPSRVDIRQMSLLGAAWTLGALKSLAEGGAASTTWYETIGWLGVLESESGCPRPDLFPSRPGMTFPLYHTLADANESPGAPVTPATSNRPLTCEALALPTPAGLRILLANLTDEPTAVLLTGLPPTVRVRNLDETTFEQATMAPEAFRADPGTPHETSVGRLMLHLKPYAYARIDTS